MKTLFKGVTAFLMVGCTVLAIYLGIQYYNRKTFVDQAIRSAMKIAGNELIVVLEENPEMTLTEDDTVSYFMMHFLAQINLKDEIIVELLEFNEDPFLFRVRVSNQFSPLDKVSVTKTIIAEQYIE